MTATADRDPPTAVLVDAQTSVIEVFVELSDTLIEDYDLQEFLFRLLTHCTRLFPAPAAGIMLRTPRGPVELVSSSSQAAEQVELFQLQAATGPCLECVTTATPVRSADLAAEAGRWPGWSEVALSAGFRSVYATPMRLRGETVGAMNLFGTQPAALTGTDLAMIQGFTDVATIGILQERAIRRSELLSGQLQAALNSRVLIEQAKGVIAGRTDLNLSVDRAFLLLREHARRTSTKLGVICQQVVDGTLDPAHLDIPPRLGR